MIARNNTTVLIVMGTVYVLQWCCIVCSLEIYRPILANCWPKCTLWTRECDDGLCVQTNRNVAIFRTKIHQTVGYIAPFHAIVIQPDDRNHQGAVVPGLSSDRAVRQLAGEYGTNVVDMWFRASPAGQMVKRLSVCR